VNKYVFLSHKISDKYPAYRNGERIKYEFISTIESGSSSNTSRFLINSHYGTHIDFPYHSLPNGKSINDYPASFFVANNVILARIPYSQVTNCLIGVEDLKFLKEEDRNAEILFIDTLYSKFRNADLYWRESIGFDNGVAEFLRLNFPKLRMIGFDQLSLTSYKHRHLGRVVHKEFFKYDILPIEDVDFTELKSYNKINSIVISPLRIDKLEAALVSIIAEINI